MEQVAGIDVASQWIVRQAVQRHLDEPIASHVLEEEEPCVVVGEVLKRDLPQAVQIVDEPVESAGGSPQCWPSSSSSVLLISTRPDYPTADRSRAFLGCWPGSRRCAG